MIIYTKDEKKIYEEALIKCLRGHNLIYTGELPFKDLFIYLLDKDELKAAMSLSLNWNWLSIKNIYYQKQVYLDSMISYLWSSMKHDIVGVKYFTPIESRMNDMKVAGFFETNRLYQLGEYDLFIYAELRSLSRSYDQTYTYIVQEKPHDIYQEILNIKAYDFNLMHGIKDKQDSKLIVALENETFIGGISFDIYEKTIYINRLSVIESYRKKGIGTALMHQVEKEARELLIECLELGTTTFQAKAFYERLGFKVIHTQKDYPKGHQTYTMMKSLD